MHSLCVLRAYMRHLAAGRGFYRFHRRGGLPRFGMVRFNKTWEQYIQVFLYSIGKYNFITASNMGNFLTGRHPYFSKKIIFKQYLECQPGGKMPVKFRLDHAAETGR